MRRSCPSAACGTAPPNIRWCAAPPNVRVGLKTAFARAGAQLPGGVEIKRSKLRGVESNGMLCSAAELGIGDDADGIMELVGDYRAGAALRDALELDDVSIDVELTPNRGDCLEHSRHGARGGRVVPDARQHNPIARPWRQANDAIRFRCASKTVSAARVISDA